MGLVSFGPRDSISKELRGNEGGLCMWEDLAFSSEMNAKFYI